MIKAVLFDMDGTLLDTESLSDLWLMTAAGLDPSIRLNEEQHRALIGSNMQRTCDLMESWFPGQVSRERILTDWPLVTMRWVAENGVPLKPFADETLRRMKALGLKLALCTSNEPEVVRCYLEHAGWERIFDEIVTAREVRHGKPAPDIFQLAAKRLGVQPDECAGVEDSLNGVRSIRAAGMTSVMIPDQMPWCDDLIPWVDLHLNGLNELEQALGL